MFMVETGEGRVFTICKHWLCAWPEVGEGYPPHHGT